MSCVRFQLFKHYSLARGIATGLRSTNKAASEQLTECYSLE